MQVDFNKTKRFNDAYDYLRSIGSFHTQKEVADVMGANPSNISGAKKGNPAILTDNFIRRFARCYPLINAEWVISGDGVMITASKEEPEQVPDLFGNEHDMLIRLETEREAMRKVIRNVNDPQTALSLLADILTANLK